MNLCRSLQVASLERFMLPDDPEFEQKAADVIGLYLNPPQHAAVFCVDEKTAIQALDRLDPVLPLVARPRRTPWLRVPPPRHALAVCRPEHEDRRVHGQTVPRHTSEDFVDFLGDVAHDATGRREIHVILDNLSAHKTKARAGVSRWRIRRCGCTSRRPIRPG